MSIKALRKIQLGREGTAGTAVAATSIWRGIGTIEDTREEVFVEEDVGYISGTDRSYFPKLGAAIAMDSIPATFEQLFHVMEAGIKTVGTGAADGGGTGKVYDYAFPETSANTIKTYTVEGGDDLEAERMEYSFVSDLSLDGKSGEAWMVNANWIGRQVAINAFTGALALVTVEEMLFQKTKLYIDTTAAAYGTTIKSSTLLAASLKIKTGWMPVFTADGNLFFQFAKLTPPEILLDVTFEHDAIGAAQKVLWRANTARKLQLKCEGSALGTPGATYTYKTMIINLAGKWEKFAKIGEQDGNDIITGTFRARYNATAADIGQIIIVNEIASVP